MTDVNIGEIAASVWDRKIGTKPSDVIFNSRALFHLLKDGGFEARVDGGKSFEVSIEFAENSNFKSYGETENLATDPVTVFDAAQFLPKTHAGTVTYTFLEDARAQGSSDKFGLIGEKLENGKDSAIADLNRSLFGDGTGNSGKDIDGLAKVIAANPAAGVVGGIDRGDYAFWRNRQLSGAKSSAAFDTLRSAMATVYSLCRGGGSGVETAPKSWITTPTVLVGFESTLTPNERYAMDSKGARGAAAGFDTDALYFKGAKGLSDEDCTAGYLYFLNPKFIKLAYYKGNFMKMSPKLEPTNQLAYVQKVHTFGQLIVSNPRRLGVVTSIT